MKAFFRLVRFLFIVATGAAILWFGPLTNPESRALGWALWQIDDRLRTTPEGEPGEPLEVTVAILDAEGLPDEIEGRTAEVAVRFPDYLSLETEIDGNSYQVGRHGEQIRISVPHQDLHLVGANDVPRFSSDPESVKAVVLPDVTNPIPRWQLVLVPAVFRVQPVEGEDRVYRCRPRSPIAKLAGIPEDLVIRVTMGGDGRPETIAATTREQSLTLALESFNWLSTVHFTEDSEDPFQTEWERVSLSHFDRFARVAIDNLDTVIPTLPPSDGSRELIARHGKGRLERIDGTQVLFLEGTPEEMGEQHGTLMRREFHNLVDRIVYGVGIGSSFDKGRWFFGEIEEAQSRLEPFIDERYLREMDAMAAAAGLHPQEARLANFFPELFHCTGFAIHGKATKGNRIYHGRVLDYLRGLGLEQNAVVMVVKPDEGNAWVNVGYAGFVGTVTAMNEKQIAIGEMGGRGEGNWDGKPMAQLMREVMERADTIDEAVEIMRKGPRTCEYYYVISDGKTKRSVGIKATPELFETVWSGESHPQLERPVEDTVLLSAGDRYEALVDRVEANYGKFDMESARALMDPPVCMNSNIQSVLFAPDTLEFWVANADSENVASLTRYTHYNLKDLLEPEETPELTVR